MSERLLLDDSGKLNMKCECGAPMPVRDTGHQGAGVARCKECRAVYDYSCWEIAPSGALAARGVRMHKIEAFRRGAARL